MRRAELFCRECDKEVKAIYRKKKIISKINGEEVTIEMELPFCEHCEAELYDLDLEDTRYDLLYDEYRKIKGLLSPKEIKEIREMYELSQRAFSRVLGFAESTINRYELGSIQDNTNNSLIKLAKSPENMSLLLDQNRKNLSPQEQEKLENRINGLLNKGDMDNESIEEKLNLIIKEINKCDNKLDNHDKKLINIEKSIKKILINNSHNKKVEKTTFDQYSKSSRPKTSVQWM